MATVSSMPQEERPGPRTDPDVLVIEAFYSGSHRQLVDCLVTDPALAPRRHLVTMAGKKWHWRARVAALHLSSAIPRNHHFRVLFSSSVLNLAELVALRPDLAGLHKVIYFHENQLHYPVRKHKDRDFQYGYNQILSCLVADSVLFNSAYNMESFLTSLPSFLKLMPDYRPQGLTRDLRPKCSVAYFPLTFPPAHLLSPHHPHPHPPFSTASGSQSRGTGTATSQSGGTGTPSSQSGGTGTPSSQSGGTGTPSSQSSGTGTASSQSRGTGTPSSGCLACVSQTPVAQDVTPIISGAGLSAAVQGAGNGGHCLPAVVSPGCGHGDPQCSVAPGHCGVRGQCGEGALGHKTQPHSQAKVGKLESCLTTHTDLSDLCYTGQGHDLPMQGHPGLVGCCGRAPSGPPVKKAPPGSEQTAPSEALRVSTPISEASRLTTPIKCEAPMGDPDSAGAAVGLQGENGEGGGEGSSGGGGRREEETCLHIVWPHRWEHDKDPETFFQVLFRLQDNNLPFVVSVLGEQFTDVPPIFAEAAGRLQGRVGVWGYQADREAYCRALQQADVVVSTSKHEFFGVAMLEAVYLGCYPLCPKSLVYPELYPEQCLYNTPNQLYKRLRAFCQRPHLARRHTLQMDLSRFSWESLRPLYLSKLNIDC